MRLFSHFWPGDQNNCAAGEPTRLKSNSHLHLFASQDQTSAINYEPAHFIMKSKRVISPRTIVYNQQFAEDFKCNFGNSIWPEYSLTQRSENWSSKCPPQMQRLQELTNVHCDTGVPIYFGVLCLMPFIPLTSRELRAGFDPCIIIWAEMFLLRTWTNLKT